MTLESRYRRLLRWYPAGWRARDHDVLLGTLLDAAEAAGRHRPRISEAASIALHGLAERADRRAAVVSSSIATAVSVIAAVLFFVQFTDGWLGGFATTALLLVVPPLLVVSGVAVLRGAGLIGARTTVGLPFAGALGGVAAATTVTLWGFWGAEEEIATLPEAVRALALPSFALAWLTVGAILVTVVLAVLRPVGEPLPLRLLPALVVGVVGAPALGYAMLTPGGAFVCSGGLLATALVTGRPHTRRLSPPPARVASHRHPDPAAFALAAFGTAAALAAALFCFIGGPLALFGLDGTGAMGAGLGLGALAGVPVLLAAARSTTPPAPRAVVVLAGAGLVVNAARIPAPFPSDDWAFAVLILSGALLAAAAARIAYPRLPGTPLTRVVLAALLGGGLLASVGIMATAVLGFLVPVAGVVVMVRSRRPTSRAAVAVA